MLCGTCQLGAELLWPATARSFGWGPKSNLCLALCYRILWSVG